LRRIRLLFHDEPGIDSYTMTAHTGAGLVNVNTRMLIAKVYGFPDVDTHAFTYLCKLIGKGDIHIPEGVFGNLTKFGSSRICLIDFSPDEGLINLCDSM